MPDPSRAAQAQGSPEDDEVQRLVTPLAPTVCAHACGQARAMGSQAREATGPCDPSWSQLDPHYTSGLATPGTQSLFLEIHPPSRPGQGSHPEFTPLAHDPHPSLSGEGGFWERKIPKAQNTLVSLSQNGERTLFETTMA